MAKYRFLPDQYPKISKYAFQKERPSSKYYTLKKRCVKVDINKLVFSDNDPRNEDVDWEHVEDLATNLLEAGADEDASLAAVTKNKNNTYTIIDHHHLIRALKKIGQEKWYVDEYEFTGIDERLKWAAATDFGFIINNSQNSVKKTTRNSVISAGLKRKKELGYIFEEGTPNDDQHIRMWLRDCRQHERFNAGDLTKIVKGILNPDPLAGKKIRNVSTDEIRDEIFASTNGEYGSGWLNNAPDGRRRHGFVVCTDTFNSDAPKWWNQVINALMSEKDVIPVFITYSKKDNATIIIKHHEGGFYRIYEQFSRSVKTINMFYENVNLTVMSQQKFKKYIENKALGQIFGEYTGESPVVERYITLTN